MADPPCAAPAQWFPVTPRPANTVATTNCQFHQWEWQEFLWLMQPSGGPSALPNFLTFAYPQDLFVANPGPYPGRAAGSNALRLAVRDLQLDESFDVTAITQAGSEDVLVDQTGHVTYYSIHLDQTFYDFVRSHGFNVAAGAMAAPDGLDFPLNGPGTVELKSAWRVVSTADSVFIPDAANRFFTTRAFVPKVSIVNGKIVAGTERIPVTVALIGMHVVGTIPGHPEFIWATFEHEDNAPDCAETPQPANNPLTSQPWSLYTAALTCSNPFSSQCNIGHAKKPVTSFAPTPVCRSTPWGDRNPDSPNAVNIRDLNASVVGMLPPARSVLSHYFLVGGTWTTGQLPATVSNMKGSLKLANTSMESFTQSQGCFSCHNAIPTDPVPFARKHIAVSHAWPFLPTNQPENLQP